MVGVPNPIKLHAAFYPRKTSANTHVGVFEFSVAKDSVVGNSEI